VQTHTHTHTHTHMHMLALASAVPNHAFYGLGLSSMTQLKSLADIKFLIICHCSYEALLQLC